MEIRFQIFELLKENKGKKLSAYDVGKLLNNTGYEVIQIILIKLNNQFKQIKVDYEDNLLKFYYEDKKK